MSNMVSEHHAHSYSDSAGVRFNGKNFAIWEFSFRVFIQGKGLLSYLDGTSVMPITSSSEIAASDKDKSSVVDLATARSTWEINNARVLSYIIGSIESSIALTLRSFPSAAAIWSHLKKTYSHVNASRYFDLEFALANLSQGELSITDYYVAATQLWTEIDLVSTSLLSSEANLELQKERKRSRCLQFIMRLRPEFEQTRSHLIAEDNMDIESVLSSLIRAETRFITQSQLDGQLSRASAFVAGTPRPQFLPRPSSTIGTVSPQNTIKCLFCQETGHPQAMCRKRNLCNYCKKSGHIISECRARARRGSIGSSKSGYSRSSNSYAIQGGSEVASQVDTHSIASTNSVSASNLNQLVQNELARALPQALTSAFASLGISGSSDQGDTGTGE
ncbi:hypothetical protein LINPERPRIM_LOCUS23053 [Linum perenne]